MSVPPGWAVLPLEQLAQIQGGIQKQPKRIPRSNAFPFLRVANVMPTGLDLSEVHQIEVFAGELETYGLARGDLLVVEGNGSASQIGRAAVWDGSIPNCVHQNHLIRVRPGALLVPEFLGLVWNSPRVRGELSAVSSSTSGLHTLSVAKLKRIMLPVPPLAEQRRIVEILVEHLDSLADAGYSLASARARSAALWVSSLKRARDSANDIGTMHSVAEVADTTLGKMLDSKRQTGEPTPYLRNINVRWGAFDLDDLQFTELTNGDRARLVLEQGDLLVCEGGEPGRCAVWRESGTGIAFQKALHRVRVRDRGQIEPEFLAAMLEEGIRLGRWDHHFTGTTIRHLPQQQLRKLEVPIPGPEVQLELLRGLSELRGSAERFQSQVALAARRAQSLRRALLAAAFSGRLTDRSLDAQLMEQFADSEFA